MVTKVACDIRYKANDEVISLEEAINKRVVDFSEKLEDALHLDISKETTRYGWTVYEPYMPETEGYIDSIQDYSFKTLNNVMESARYGKVFTQVVAHECIALSNASALSLAIDGIYNKISAKLLDVTDWNDTRDKRISISSRCMQARNSMGGKVFEVICRYMKTPTTSLTQTYIVATFNVEKALELLEQDN